MSISIPFISNGTEYMANIKTITIDNTPKIMSDF